MAKAADPDPLPPLRVRAVPHRYHHGDLAQALIAAVRTLVERDGPDRLSISEACRMAGVSTAAPYKHFRDKVDILRHVCAQGFDELYDAMDAARASTPAPGPERVAAIGKCYVAFALAHPGTFRIMFGMKRELMEPDDPEGLTAAAQCFEVVIGEVAGAAGLEPDSDAAKRLAIILWSFVHGVATLTLDGDYEVTEVEVDADAMIDQAAHGLLASVRPI